MFAAFGFFVPAARGADRFAAVIPASRAQHGAIREHDATQDFLAI
jgi:hypothetical protein